MRIKYEAELLVMMSYCLVFKHQDFTRAHEMLKLVTPEQRSKLSEYITSLLTQAEKEAEEN
jgi:Spy/CpxP family protein refolding chaperone